MSYTKVDQVSEKVTITSLLQLKERLACLKSFPPSNASAMAAVAVGGPTGFAICCIFAGFIQ